MLTRFCFFLAKDDCLTMAEPCEDAALMVSHPNSDVASLSSTCSPRAVGYPGSTDLIITAAEAFPQATSFPQTVAAWLQLPEYIDIVASEIQVRCSRKIGGMVPMM